jgi:hypothetical protein
MFANIVIELPIPEASARSFEGGYKMTGWVSPTFLRIGLSMLSFPSFILTYANARISGQYSILLKS